MRAAFFSTFLILILVPGVATASDWAVAPTDRPQGDHRATPLATAVAPYELIEDFWILPWFTIDRRSGAGVTTLLAIRNPFGSQVDVEISYRSPSGAVLHEDLFRLDPFAVSTINLRDIGALTAGPDGFARGFAVVETELPTSTDYFIVNPGENFATAGRLIEDECRLWDLRYLVGGGFSGGTSIQIFVFNPLGGNPATDPASAVLTFVTEGGQLIGTINFWTDDPANEVVVADMLSAFPGSPPFGYVEIEFAEGTQRGHVQGTFDAEGRYSVSLTGSCVEEF